MARSRHNNPSANISINHNILTLLRVKCETKADRLPRWQTSLLIFTPVGDMKWF